MCVHPFGSLQLPLVLLLGAGAWLEEPDVPGESQAPSLTWGAGMRPPKPGV